MTKIYRLKKNWGHGLGYGKGIVIDTSNKKGERFFGIPNESFPETMMYYPENGGYAVWERDDYKFVDEYFELIGESDKKPDYFINPIYTQEQMDEVLKSHEK